MKKNVKKILLFMMIIVSIFLGTVTVSASSKCKVTFYCGREKIATRVVSTGTKISLSHHKEVEGYTYVGWDTSSKGHEVIYTPGQVITVTSNMNLYQANRKNCKITFYAVDDKRNQKIIKTIYTRQYWRVILPSIPKWTNNAAPNRWHVVTNTEKKYYSPAEKVPVYGDMKVYAYYKSYYDLRFYSSKGKLEKTVKIPATSPKYRLHGKANTKDQMFMGWATRKNASLSSEYYQAGSILEVKSNMNLYPVLYDKRLDQTRMLKNITAYDKVYFIGDSRMNATKSIVNKEYLGDKNKLTFYAKGGTNLTWFVENYEKIMLNQIKAQSGKQAVVFGLGVNSCLNYAAPISYVEYINTLANNLKKYKVDVYFVSVNPVNNNQLANWISLNPGRLSQRKECYVVNFNSYMKKNIKCHYIDTNSYLKKTGYVTANGFDVNNDDGLHYSKSTYRKIWNYMVDCLNGA